MSKIKFRAFDKLDNKYYFDIQKVYDSSNYPVSSFGEFLTAKLEDENGIYLDESMFDVEQFTGLYDCTTWAELTEPEREEWTSAGNMPREWKGREIYEGDRVELQNELGLCAWSGPVSHDDEYTGFIPFSHFSVDILARVIGNIHERA